MSDEILFELPEEMRHTPTPEQQAAMDDVIAFVNDGRKSISITGAAGTGKCLGRGTPVLKFDGAVVPVEAVKTGDLLMGPDSTPRRVLSVADGVGPLFKVIPKTGDPWVCNDVHVLTLVHTTTNEVRDIPLPDWFSASQDLRQSFKQFAVPVEFSNSAELPIDPYFLGLWFGDGTKTLRAGALRTVAVSKPDEEVRATCIQMADRWGLKVTMSGERSNPTWHLVGAKGQDNPLLDMLRRLVGEACVVPSQYLVASRAARLEFLAGWLDSDGHLTCNCYEIAQKRPDYTEAITFLARSLGFRVTAQLKTVNEKSYHRLHISGRTDEIPMRVSRKKASPRLQRKDVLRTGISIEPIGSGKYFGFELDGDGRFLLGDFTVTHNTKLLQFLKPYFPDKKVVWTAMTGKAAQRIWEVTGEFAKTLHGTLYEPPTVDHNVLEFDSVATPSTSLRILIVDECSMMTPRVYEDLGEWESEGIKVIYVGDSFQLPPIMSAKEIQQYGEDFSVFSKVPGPRLTTVMRSVGPIVQVATHLREKKVMPRESNEGYTYSTATNPTAAAVQAYLDDPDDHAIITWRNEVRMEANRMVRAQYGLQGPIAKNEPILVRKNGQGLLNGDVCKVKSAALGPKLGKVQTVVCEFEGIGKPIYVTMQGAKEVMDGGQPYLPDKSDYWNYRNALRKEQIPEPLPITYGYCLTAHLAQGSQFRRVTVFLRKDELASPPFLKQSKFPDGQRIAFGVRWLYTAVTRAKAQLAITTD